MSVIRIASTVAPATTRIAGPVPEAVERIWLTIAEKSWSSLAIVPADDSVADDAILLAHALVDTSAEHGARTLQVLDGTRAQLRDHVRLVTALRLNREPNGLIVPLQPLSGPPAGLALARATSASIVIARLHTTALADIRRVSDGLGSQHLLGCVVVR